MAILIGNHEIKIIQGQTKDIRRKFKGEVTEQISSVIISCKRYNLEFELLKTENNEFTYRLTDELTSTFDIPKGKNKEITTYDMTINFIDGSVAIETGIAFIVIARQNPLNEED